MADLMVDSKAYNSVERKELKLVHLMVARMGVVLAAKMVE